MTPDIGALYAYNHSTGNTHEHLPAEQFPNTYKMLGKRAVFLEQPSACLPLSGRIEWLEHQESYAKRSYAELLSALPPGQVTRGFGPEMLLWAHMQNVEVQISYSDMLNGAAAYVNKQIVDSRLAELERLGFSLQGVKNAMRWCSYRLRNSFGVFLSQYQMGHSLEQGLVEGVDIAKLLDTPRSLAKIGLQALNVQKEEFGPDPLWLDPEWDETSEIEWYYRIFLDSPAAFLMTRKEKPAAVCALEVQSPATVMINQLQPVYLRPPLGSVEHKRPSRALREVNWQAVLVGAAEQMAASLGFREVAIQGGRNNYWTGQRHMTVAEAKRRYDAPAWRLGYRFNKQDGNWYKPV